MSTKIYKSQTYRPYKIEVYGLQDDYIGTLQSYDDSFIGRVSEPKITLSDDGTQTLTCSIPRFYIDPKTNKKEINPRWEDINNGVLAENTRVLKVFINEEKVYPFIVDKIIDKRDSHFAAYKEITANGLAFAELGKVGLKLELTSDTVEADYEKDNTVVPTINYWLDKVFPNEKDESGKVMKWNTPWCYEIRMDWRDYTDKDSRESTKVYEDAFIDAWKEENGELVPTHVSESEEKARYLSSEVNSNKYNITQTIAETFGVFCYYEYKCANNGQFVGEYVDENGQVWRGKKVVFCNRAIKTDNPFYIDYQKNLQTISRTCDSSEIYTKLVVDSIQSDTMTDGYITIANTAANPLADDFILNFDYLYSQGAITDYQKEYIENYKVQLHKINSNIAEKEEKISELEVEANDKDALAAGYEKTISSAKEELVHYQTLRDNEVTNTPVVKDKDNAFSVVFVNSDTMTEAQIRLEGVAAGTIRGYTDYKHEIQAFNSVVPVSAIGPIAENDENVYCVLDEYGYAASLYTGKNNAKLGELSPSGYVIYLDLQYSPYNKYKSICEQLENTIILNTTKKTKAENEATELQAELDAKVSERETLLAEKDKLNNDFESILGPALREGHWTPSDYEDIGETCKEEYTATTITFDTELFDEEENGYYYASNADIEANKKTYYDYINVSSIYPVWRENQSELMLSLSNPSFTYKATTALNAGKYYVIYNMKYYVFELLFVAKEQQLTLTVDGEVKITIGNTSYAGTEQVETPSDAANITNLFENINNTLGELTLYNNAGFVFAYLKNTVAGVTSVIPVLLLNKTTIKYHLYKTIKWKLGDNSGNVSITTGNASAAICYPRIIINKKDVNYDADTLTLEVNEETLEKYTDYSILLRKGMPHITLKPTDKNSFYNIFSNAYFLTYQVSQANKTLYRDALEVAKENSQPKYSYEISISQTPDDIEYFEIGQLCRITDSSLGVKAVSGYISQIELSLDSPKDDSITIQNYKTKFEDLFATITASSEAMKQNKTSYDMAANSFTVGGLLEGSILQDTFNNNKIDLEFSNTQVSIDDTNGIALTNTEPYSNGVYGQVIMRGGGIFLSNRTDENGERVWTTGITPNGINASVITTGQLDTNLIRVFAGKNLAFQWNSEGLYAYKKEGTEYKADTYVRYSDKGLQFFDNGFAAVDLGWNGLAINTQEGALTLTGENGLSLYKGAANSEKTNHLVRIGRFVKEDGTYDYGLRLYKTYDNTAYSETLVAGNNGQLWLKDYLSVGGANTTDNLAGISGLVNGVGETVSGGGATGGNSSTSGSLEGGSANSNATNPNKSVRFWAGSTFVDRNDAPFRVLQDGSVFATNLTVGGGSVVGNYTIDEINEAMNRYDSTLTSSAGLTYNKDAESETTTLIVYFTLGGINTVVPKGYTLQLQEKNLNNESSEYTTIESAVGGSSSIVRTGIVKDENKSYRSMVTTKDGKQIAGETISFTAVENGKNGIDGTVPAYEQEWYAVSSNSSTWPEDDSSEWTTSYEEISKEWSSAKPYLWKREKFTTDTKWRHSLMAAYGVDGVGISAIKSWYLLTISDEMPGTPENSTLGWMQIGIGTSVLKTTVYKPYLWTCTSITFDNGRIQYETPYVASNYSFSLKSIENQYMLTSTKTAPSSDNAGWKTYIDGQSLPETTSIMPYLWNREKLTYDEITNLKEATTEYQYRTEYTAPHIADDYNDGTIEIQNWYHITDVRTVNDLPELFAKQDENGEWFDEGGHWELEYDTTKLSATNPVVWEIERKLSTRTGWSKSEPRILTIQGQNGQSIGGIVELYRLWNSATDAPLSPKETGGWEQDGKGRSNWTNKAVKPSSEPQYCYLWNCEGILLTKDSDGKYEYTTPQYAYSYTDKVLSRTEYYQVSNNGETPPSFNLENSDYEGQGWYTPYGKTTITSQDKPYLWNVSLYKYVADDGAKPELKEWQVIGTHGKDGEKGDKGEPGAQGDPGKDGVAYSIKVVGGTDNLPLSAIYRKTEGYKIENGNPIYYSPETIIISVDKIIGDTISSSQEGTIYVYKLPKFTTDTNSHLLDKQALSEENKSLTIGLNDKMPLTFEGESGKNEYYFTNFQKSLLIEYWLNGELIQQFSLPFDHSEDTSGWIEWDNATNGGKTAKIDGANIYAKTVMADAIASNAIITRHISSDFSLDIYAEHRILIHTGAYLTLQSGADMWIGSGAKLTIQSGADLFISSGGDLTVKSGGTFSVESNNFNIDAEGNVSLTGKITAKSGEIGGWIIGETSLYSGTNGNYVALNTDAANDYAIWAGGETGGSAPFVIKKTGEVYAKNLFIKTLKEGKDSNSDSLTEDDYDTTQLDSYPLWAIWGNWRKRITDITKTSDGYVSSIKLVDGTELNFTNAGSYDLSVSSSAGTGDGEFYITSKKGNKTVKYQQANLSVSGADSQNTSYADYSDAYINVSANGVTVSNVLPIGNIYTAGQEAAQPVKVVEGQTQGKGTATLANGATTKEDAVDIFAQTTYEVGQKSVTLSEVWKGAEYTVTASNSRSISTQIAIAANGGGEDNFTVYAGPTSGPGGPEKAVYGTVKGELSGQTVNIKFGDTIYGTVNVASVYDNGWKAAANSVVMPSAVTGGESLNFTVKTPSAATVGSTISNTFTMSVASPSASGGFVTVLYNGSVVAKANVSGWYTTGYSVGKTDGASTERTTCVKNLALVTAGSFTRVTGTNIYEYTGAYIGFTDGSGTVQKKALSIAKCDASAVYSEGQNSVYGYSKSSTIKASYDVSTGNYTLTANAQLSNGGSFEFSQTLDGGEAYNDGYEAGWKAAAAKYSHSQTNNIITITRPSLGTSDETVTETHTISTYLDNTTSYYTTPQSPRYTANGDYTPQFHTSRIVNVTYDGNYALERTVSASGTAYIRVEV